MFQWIRQLWFSLRLRWSIHKLTKAVNTQSKAIGESLVPAIRDCAQATELLIAQLNRADFQGRNFDYWEEQF